MRCAASLGPAPPLLDAWLQKRGLPPQPLSLRSVPRGGRGLVAVSPIPAGAALLRVPEALLLTRQRCVADAPEPLRAALDALPEWSCLAAFLSTQRALGNASDWAPYLAALPDAPGGLLSWPPAAVPALLRGTSLAPEAASRLASVDAAAAAMPPALRDAGATAQSLRWSFAQLFSRLIRLPGLSDTLALVPWADFLNHGCAGGSAHLDWCPAERCVVLQSRTKAYAPGDEVTASYGARSSGELLLSYGFAPCAQPGEAKLNAPNEAVTLRLRLRTEAQDAAAPLRRQAWARMQRRNADVGASADDDGSTAAFALRAGGGFAPGLLPWARLATAPVGGEAQAAMLAADAATDAPACAAPPPSRAEDAAAREFVLDAIREALRELDAADAAVPAASAKGGKARGKAPPLAPRVDPELVAAVAAVRRVERRVLQRAEFVLRAELRALR